MSALRGEPFIVGSSTARKGRAANAVSRQQVDAYKPLTWFGSYRHVPDPSAVSRALRVKLFRERCAVSQVAHRFITRCSRHRDSPRRGPARPHPAGGGRSGLARDGTRQISPWSRKLRPRSVRPGPAPLDSRSRALPGAHCRYRDQDYFVIGSRNCDMSRGGGGGAGS